MLFVVVYNGILKKFKKISHHILPKKTSNSTTNLGDVSSLLNEEVLQNIINYRLWLKY